MMNLALFVLFLSTLSHAYVPTVESLFRHGSNPDVTANGISLTFAVKRIIAGSKDSLSHESSLLKETREVDYYKLFLTRFGQDILKIAQTRYENNTFSESSLSEKIYFPNLSPLTFKAGAEDAEKGVFIGFLVSALYNDGNFLIQYLKAMGIPVRLNSEIINREKIEYLADYKRYLISISKNRSAKKTEVNPLRPDDPAAREKVEKVMGESMYVDTNQVQLFRENGEMSWLVSAGNFEAIVSYRDREIQRMRFRSQLGDFEIICKDHWLANGTHAMPRYILVKDFKGESYQVEVTNLRHYLEKEDDIVKRLKKWDALLRGKESLGPKPSFLL